MSVGLGEAFRCGFGALTPESRLVASSPEAGIYNFSLVVVTQSAVPRIEAS